jgi:PadR family transcriptional regulator PadR
MTPPSKVDFLQGTLDMLIMRAVLDEPLHGYGVAERLKLLSGDRLQIPQGSLYPALHKLEYQRMLKSEWGPTKTGREAKFYRITAKGKKRLEAEMAGWQEAAMAIALVLRIA